MKANVSIDILVYRQHWRMCKCDIERRLLDVGLLIDVDPVTGYSVEQYSVAGLMALIGYSHCGSSDRKMQRILADFQARGIIQLIPPDVDSTRKFWIKFHYIHVSAAHSWAQEGEKRRKVVALVAGDGSESDTHTLNSSDVSAALSAAHSSDGKNVSATIKPCTPILNDDDDDECKKSDKKNTDTEWEPEREIQEYLKHIGVHRPSWKYTQGWELVDIQAQWALLVAREGVFHPQGLMVEILKGDVIRAADVAVVVPEEGQGSQPEQPEVPDEQPEVFDKQPEVFDKQSVKISLDDPAVLDGELRRTSPGHAWAYVKGYLKSIFDEWTYVRNVEPLEIECFEDGVLTLRTDDYYAAEWARYRYTEPLLRAFKVAGVEVERVVVNTPEFEMDDDGKPVSPLRKAVREMEARKAAQSAGELPECEEVVEPEPPSMPYEKSDLARDIARLARMDMGIKRIAIRVRSAAKTLWERGYQDKRYVEFFEKRIKRDDYWGGKVLSPEKIVEKFYQFAGAPGGIAVQPEKDFVFV